MKRKKKTREDERPVPQATNTDPVGVAIVAAGGAAAGAAVGSVGGPVGAVVGAAVGGLAGGLAGKTTGAVNPAVEDAHWQASYRAAPYVDPAHEYHYYQPAYRFGWESYSQYGRRSFDEIDETLMRDWDCRRGHSLQTWNEARDAARDAWERVARQQRQDSRAAGAGESARGRRRIRKRDSRRPPTGGRSRKRS